MGLVVRSGRLQGGKFVILLLISAEEAANGQQHERGDREIIDQKGKRPCTGLCAGDGACYEACPTEDGFQLLISPCESLTVYTVSGGEAICFQAVLSDANP